MRVKDYVDSKKRVTSAQCSFSIGYKRGREDILNKIKKYIEFAKKENISTESIMGLVNFYNFLKS